MKKLLLALAFALLSTQALAQGNPQCPTRPSTDSSNACASTAFVHNVAANTYVNIEDFGASSSASAATNTAAIQAAVNSVTAGGTVYVPHSGYNINGTITISSPLTILCAPYLDVSTGNINGAGSSGIMFAINANYVRIMGCYLNRSGSSAVGDKGIAVGTNAVNFNDGACTNGSPTITSPGSQFTGATIGMRIYVPSCATAGAPLFATVTAVGGAGSLTVTPSAGNTASGLSGRLGNVYIETVLRDVYTVNHDVGVHFINAAQSHVDHLYSNAKIGLQVENQLAADYGDSFVSDSTILSTDDTNGFALYYLSGGGLKVSNNKLLHGKYGMHVNWNLGSSGGPVLSNNHIESFATTGIFVTTPASLTRMSVTGGSIAGASTANAITIDNTSASALTDIAVIGVTMTGIGASSMVDVGKVSGATISGLTIDNGAAGTCINLRSNSTLVTALLDNSYMNCSVTIANAGTLNKTGVTLLGIATGTSLALGGCTLGSNAFCVTGTAVISGTTTLPTLIGGTGTGSSLTLQSTSGVGATDSILFKVGNNGATTAGIINTTAQWGIGTSTPLTNTKVTININASAITSLLGVRTQPVQIVGADASATGNAMFGFGAAPSFSALRAGGTIASPTQVTTNQQIFAISAGGYFTGGSAGWSNSVAQILLRADGNFSDTSQPTNLSFQVTPAGSITVAEAWGINNAGELSGIGNVNLSTAGKTLVLKQGANGATGTFVCTSGGTITINNTNIAITDTISISLNTVGGTISTTPAVKAITAATSFQTLCATSDTSTYNYAIIKNAA